MVDGSWRGVGPELGKWESFSLCSCPRPNFFHFAGQSKKYTVEGKDCVQGIQILLSTQCRVLLGHTYFTQPQSLRQALRRGFNVVVLAILFLRPNIAIVLATAWNAWNLNMDCTFFPTILPFDIFSTLSSNVCKS